MDAAWMRTIFRQQGAWSARERSRKSHNFSLRHRTGRAKNSLKSRTRRPPGSTKSKVWFFKNVGLVVVESDKRVADVEEGS
jgi:hypothetical protein